MISSTQMVLQGEMLVVKGEENRKILSPRPHSCTIFSLFDPGTKITVLAHIDDYTCVTDTFKKLERTLVQHNASFKTCKFQAKVLGGTQDAFSVKQQQAILGKLASYKIEVELISLSKSIGERPQVLVDTNNGKMQLLPNKEINWRIEYFQACEYGDFNTFLDKKYTALDGADVPYFQVMEATRTLGDVPPFELTNIDPNNIKTARIQVSVNLSSSRVNVANLTPELKLPKHPERKEVITDPALHLKKMAEALDSSTALNTIKEKDFNKLLRQLASDPAHFNMLEFLYDYRNELGVDLGAKGEKSGTALDVATKYNNQKAINLLKNT